MKEVTINAYDKLDFSKWLKLALKATQSRNFSLDDNIGRSEGLIPAPVGGGVLFRQITVVLKGLGLPYL